MGNIDPQLLVFVGNHPVVACFAMLFSTAFVISLMSLPFTFMMRLVNRVIRHLNISKCGWPPSHLDADGDWKQTEEED
jgi:hypothetical protein